PIVLADDRLSEQFIRPGNLSFLSRETLDGSGLAISFGSPLREILILAIDYNQLPWKFSGQYHLQPELFRNGYGRVYTAAFNHENRELLAVFSPEGSLLKTVVYDLEPEPHEILSDVLTINGARFIRAAEIMTTDFNGDGDNELLIPFDNGDLAIVSIVDGELQLNISDLNGHDLFILPEPATESDINNMVMARIENGLFSTLRTEPVRIASVSKEEVEDYLDPDFPLDVEITDTIMLGDQFFQTVITDTVAEFYSLQWLIPPPEGVAFDPVDGTITWFPTVLQIGPHQFKYRTEQRIGEKILIVEDTSGLRHQIVPVLTETITDFGVLVEDSIVVVPETFTISDAKPSSVMELYSVAALIPDDKIDNRFIFEGVPPFGLTTAEFTQIGAGKSLMHSITADVTNIIEDKKISFSYSSPVSTAKPTATFKVIHDLDNNLMTLLITPVIEGVRQSLNPEDLAPELYQFPEYFFSGLPENMTREVLGQKLQFSISEDTLTQDTQLSFVGITSPANPAHLLTLYFNRGTLEAIRGEVKIQPTGSKKIITEFDFSGKFNPVRISTQLRIPRMLTQAGETGLFDSSLVSAGTELEPAVIPDFGLEFEPGDYVKIYDDDSYDFSAGNITVAAWIKTTGLNKGEAIISKDGEFRLAFDNNSQLEFWTVNDSGIGNIIVSPLLFPQDSWIHIAAVQDSMGMRLFENGNLVAQNSLTGKMIAGDKPVYLGGWDFFSGYLDEIMISSSGYYSANFIPVPMVADVDSALSGLWHFNTGQGYSVIDMVKNNNGEIFGAQWVPVDKDAVEQPESEE
ncbi:MAG: LamG domain-containing protein, partial [Candidatus Marinimicrobia bacterium]|nr:LamG domain-containing protein [Candidatus Neomarinimicrobiota bacterium]